MSEEIGRLGGSKKIDDTRLAPTEAADRNKHEFYEFGPLRLDTTERKLTRGDEVIALTPKVFDMLVMLVRNSGHLLEKDELIRSLWPDSFVEEGNLSTNIFMLRKALGNDHEYIETVPRRGYRFVGAVRQLPNTEKPPSEPWELHAGPAERSPAGLVMEAVPSVLAKMGSAATSRGSAIKARWAAVWLIGGIVVMLLASGYWYLSRPLTPPRITAYAQITHDGHGKILVGTDGSRLYFNQDFIAQIGVNGGEIAPLPIVIPGAADIRLWDISPDGANALVGSLEPGHSNAVQRFEWVASVMGGPAKRLAEGLPGKFSPDGTSVIFSTADGDIYVVRTDGTGKHKLAHTDRPAEFFSWSPDGRVIRFDDGSLLWEMSPDGSGIHRLLPDWKEPGLQAAGVWTPDGSFFLFHLYNSNTRDELWALDERRGFFRPRSPGPTRLTTGPIQWRRPVPSRDGTKIFAGGFVPRGELTRIDFKTGSFQPFLGGISAEFVSFSPGGKSVAYVLFPEGTLWKADRDGSSRMQLSNPPESASNPRWSPDSKQILFNTASPDAPHSRIYLVSADGGVPQRLLPGDQADMYDANWSPDGKKVLLGHGTYPSDKEDLRILDLDGGQVTVVPGSSNMFSPRWSPDGRYATAIYNDYRPNLPVFDFKTQQWAKLPVSGVVAFPSFSRDSRFIYYLQRSGHDLGVFRIPVTGGKEERVVDMSGWHLTGYFGFSMNLDPTDAPLVTRDVGTDDIYALTLEH